MRFLQEPQLAHPGEGVQSFHNDKLLGVTEALLQQGLQDGRALPAHVGSDPWGWQAGPPRHQEANQTANTEQLTEECHAARLAQEVKKGFAKKVNVLRD